MSKLRLFLTASLLGLTAVTVGACATAPQAVTAPPSATAAADAPEAPADATTYGLFLAGQAAMNQGEGERASQFYAQAVKRDPDAGFLQERAFTAALVAGDVHRAAQLAPAADQGSPNGQRLGRLTRAVDALALGDGREARAALGVEPMGVHRAGGLLLTAWVDAAAGDWKAALTLPDAHGERLITTLTRLNQALLLERAHHFAEADTAFRQLIAEGDGAGVTTADYAQFLERRGRRADAVGLCEGALKGDPNNRLIKQIRDRAAAGGPPPPMPSLAQGAAQSLLAPAAIFLAERQPELGVAYLRLILRLDPDRDEAWILLGDALNGAGQVEPARAAYQHVPATSAGFVEARGRLIQTYDQPGDADKALALAQETVKVAPDDDQALAVLADALRADEKFADSAKVMDQLMAHLGAQAGWEAYYMRGIALDRSGHWPEAERDFRKALTLKPDESEVLNYLGYSWIDRGEKLEEAKAMVEKAVAAKPDSGAMVDSLGWAYYRLGDYVHAVEQLERAAELEPADPDINDHLGDAYWRAGRRIEAQFQWNRVLSLGPSPKLRADVEAKLKFGLNPDGGPGQPPPAVASR